jgi:hypothetical protein
MSNQKRTKLNFHIERNAYCCGVLEIGDFELDFVPSWRAKTKTISNPVEYTPEEGLARFQEDLKTLAMDGYFDGSWDDWDSQEFPENGVALVRATVVDTNEGQRIAKEYMEQDGWTKISEFANVNSPNTVFAYQKELPVGQWLHEKYGGSSSD